MTRQHEQRRGDRGAHERRSGADARGLLDERLARGDIDATEYQKLRGLIAAGDDQAPLAQRAADLRKPAALKRYGSGRP